MRISCFIPSRPLPPPRLTLRRLVRCLTILSAACLAAAPASAQDPAAALRSRLTPTGAERAGNADGTIPPWTGAVTPADPAGSETPLLVIGHANAQQYAARLPEGALAQIRKEHREAAVAPQGWLRRRRSRLGLARQSRRRRRVMLAARRGVMRHFHPSDRRCAGSFLPCRHCQAGADRSARFQRGIWPNARTRT
jgi:hypothetical protein